MQEALGDLRRALERPLAPLPPETGSTLAAQLERVCATPQLPLAVNWPATVKVPSEFESLAQSVLAEALRNIGKHAEPTRVEVNVDRDEDTFTLEVRNDGARPTRGEGGMGLRLAGFEALQRGGMVEFGTTGGDGWRVRLVVPLRREHV
jgi:signal transduction histidine kinase